MAAVDEVCFILDEACSCRAQPAQWHMETLGEGGTCLCSSQAGPVQDGTTLELSQSSENRSSLTPRREEARASMGSLTVEGWACLQPSDSENGSRAVAGSLHLPGLCHPGEGAVRPLAPGTCPAGSIHAHRAGTRRREPRKRPR